MRYAELLAGPGVVRGLLGPREPAVIWSRHILNCAALVPLIPRDATVVDLGSGAGLPGVVLALARADLKVTLVEPLARRTAFLAEILTELDLPHVRLTRARAEDVAGSVSARVVVARAVAPLLRLVPLALPLVQPGGELLAIKGRGAGDELARAAPTLAKYDAHGDILALATPGTPETTTVVRVRAAFPDPQQ